MRLLLAIAALLASVAVNAGELDGKGIKCVQTDPLTFPSPDAVTYMFSDGNAVQWLLPVRGTEVELKVGEFGGPYVVSPSRIEFPGSGEGYGGGSKVTFYLDRAALELRHRNPRQDWHENKYQCEVYQSQEAFKEMLETARLEKQKAIDEEMKDNKI